jgi:hypothetical protein
MPDGAPQSIALMEKASMGGSWSDAGTILLAISWMLYFVPAGGGEPKLLEMPDRLGDGRNTYAEFLAGSEDFLFFHSTPEDPGEGSIYLATLRDGKAVNPSLLLRNATPVRYTPAGGGRILFVRIDNLYSQKLNRSSRTLEGEAELVVQGIASGARADFSVARNGTLAWRPGSAAYTQATEFDREGNVMGTSGPKAIMQSLRLSPDEKQLLATGENGYTGSLVDIGQTGRIDLPKGVGWIGWLAGGSKLIGRRAGAVVVMPAVGSGEVREIRSLEADFSPMTVSPDGKSLGGPYRHAGSFFAPVDGAPEEGKPNGDCRRRWDLPTSFFAGRPMGSLWICAIEWRRRLCAAVSGAWPAPPDFRRRREAGLAWRWQRDPLRRWGLRGVDCGRRRRDADLWRAAEAFFRPARGRWWLEHNAAGGVSEWITDFLFASSGTGGNEYDPCEDWGG